MFEVSIRDAGMTTPGSASLRWDGVLSYDNAARTLLTEIEKWGLNRALPTSEVLVSWVLDDRGSATYAVIDVVVVTAEARP